MSSVELVRSESAVVVPDRPARPVRTVGLAPVEAKAAAGLVAGDEREIVAIATARATALASPYDALDARQRSLARVVAVTESQMSTISALLMQRIVQRDEAAIRVLDRVLASATQRYVACMAEMRLQAQTGRRAVVMVAKGPVAIAAQE